MKKLIILLISVAFFSCNNNKLNEYSIDKLYHNCVDKGFYKNVVLEKILLGDKRILNPKINPTATYDNYKKLADLGLITFEKSNSKYLGFQQYNISITEKGKPFLIDKNKKTFVRCYDLKIKEVKDIVTKKDVPFAQAKLVLEKINATPFALLTNKDDKTILLNLNKTKDNWVLCK